MPSRWMFWATDSGSIRLSWTVIGRSLLIGVYRDADWAGAVPLACKRHLSELGRGFLPRLVDMFDAVIHVTCKHCQAKNRLQVTHLLDEPRCGRCHAPLLGADVPAMPDVLSTVRQHPNARQSGEEGDSP